MKRHKKRTMQQMADMEGETTELDAKVGRGRTNSGSQGTGRSSDYSSRSGSESYDEEDELI